MGAYTSRQFVKIQRVIQEVFFPEDVRQPGRDGAVVSLSGGDYGRLGDSGFRPVPYSTVVFRSLLRFRFQGFETAKYCTNSADIYLSRRYRHLTCSTTYEPAIAKHRRFPCVSLSIFASKKSPNGVKLNTHFSTTRYSAAAGRWLCRTSLMCRSGQSGASFLRRNFSLQGSLGS